MSFELLLITIRTCNDAHSAKEMKGSCSSCTQPSNHTSTWRQIKLEDVIIGDMIGGGGFALVYKGEFEGERVAIKALVRIALRL